MHGSIEAAAAPPPPRGRRENIAGEYSELLASSVFCLVMMGDGWTARMDDATLHGCGRAGAGGAFAGCGGACWGLAGLVGSSRNAGRAERCCRAAGGLVSQGQQAPLLSAWQQS